MKISIITINYNNIDGLKATFESVLSQTYIDKEFIVIDGGSTDGAREFLNSHSLDMAYWCCEMDNGLYDAMNKGIMKSKGDYLIFMNSGDRFFNDKVLSDIFGNNNYTEDVLYGSTVYEYDGKGVLRTPRAVSVMAKELPWCHQSTFVRGDVMREILYDTKYKIIADYAFFYKLWNEDYSFRLINKIVSIYDTTGMSADSSRSKQIFRERCMIYGKKFSVISYWFKLFRQEIRKIVRNIIPTNIMDIIMKRPKDSTKCVDIMDIKQL